MDSHLNALLYIVLLIKLWPALAAPTQAAPADYCKNLGQTIKHTELLKDGSAKLLDKYQADILNVSFDLPAEIPDATIVGSNTSEKLQSICAKERIFKWYLSQIEVYLKSILPDPDQLQKLLVHTKTQLSHNLAKIMLLLNKVDPKHPPLATVAPPAFPFTSNYKNKYYGLAAIATLTDLLTQVVNELRDLAKTC